MEADKDKDTENWADFFSSKFFGRVESKCTQKTDVNYFFAQKVVCV